MRKRIHLNIGGMTCINCQNKIENALRLREGVLLSWHQKKCPKCRQGRIKRKT